MFPYYVFFFSLVFDFRGTEDGGSALQFIMFFSTLVSGLYIIITTSLKDIDKTVYRKFLLSFVAVLASTIIVALINNVDLSRYARVAVGYFLLMLGMMVGIRLLLIFNFNSILNLIYLASMVSVLFTIVYGFSSSNVDIGQIRYQILSPLLAIAVPILVYKIWIGGGGRGLDYPILLSLFGLIMVSSTRSMLLLFWGVVLLGIYLSSKRGVNAVFDIFFKVGFVILLMFVGIYLFSPDALDRMIDRFNAGDEYAFDITSATRIAEIDFQLNAWLGDVLPFFLGLGLGSEYGFSGEYALLLMSIFGDEGLVTDWWAAGHNFWVYSMYSQGALFGWVVPYIFGYVGYISYIRLSDINNATDGDLYKLVFLVVAAFFLSTIGGNMMGTRVYPLFFGVFLGLFLFRLQIVGRVNYD